jgi:hypothetical protein
MSLDELARTARRSALDPALAQELNALIAQEQIHNEQELELALERHPDLRDRLQAAAQQDADASA